MIRLSLYHQPVQSIVNELYLINDWIMTMKLGAINRSPYLMNSNACIKTCRLLTTYWLICNSCEVIRVIQRMRCIMDSLSMIIVWQWLRTMKSLKSSNDHVQRIASRFDPTISFWFIWVVYETIIWITIIALLSELVNILVSKELWKIQRYITEKPKERRIYLWNVYRID